MSVHVCVCVCVLMAYRMHLAQLKVAVKGYVLPEPIFCTKDTVELISGLSTSTVDQDGLCAKARYMLTDDTEKLCTVVNA